MAGPYPPEKVTLREPVPVSHCAEPVPFTLMVQEDPGATVPLTTHVPPATIEYVKAPSTTAVEMPAITREGFPDGLVSVTVAVVEVGGDMPKEFKVRGFGAIDGTT